GAQCTLRCFGKQCRNRIAQAGINYARQPIDQVAGRPAVRLDCPPFLDDMMRCPDSRLTINKLSVEYQLKRHRRTGNDAHLAWLNHARAKKPTLCIAATRNDRDARQQTQMMSGVLKK